MTFGIYGNTAKPVIKKITKQLISFLSRKNISFILHSELGKLLGKNKKYATANEKDLPGQCDMLIALGGDGTILSAARLVGKHKTPILGVNLGKLGFLAEISVDELEECISDILKKKFIVEERLALQAISKKDKKKYFGLNEIVIDNGASPRVVELETYVNDDYLVTYSADGIVLATPTGSTAYSLAMGGPLVAPQSNVIIINPMAPHTLTARPVIVPDDSVIKVRVKFASKQIHISSDGQMEGFYDVPAEFEIKKTDYKIKLVKRKQRTFYDLLRTKLMWGRDVRVKG